MNVDMNANNLLTTFCKSDNNWLFCIAQYIGWHANWFCCLAELNSEQKALVDFLVLSRGRGFVGFGSSTFSFYLREYRVLRGIPRSSSVLVDASVIGTDPLFNSAGTVI